MKELKELLLQPPDISSLQEQGSAFISEKIFSSFKFIFIASLPALREITYILALFFMIGGILGIQKSYKLAGESVIVNLFMGMMQIAFKYM